MSALNSFLKVFTPKNKIFFDLFETMVNDLVIMGEKMSATVNESNYDRRAEILKEIENLEHLCDDTSHQIFTELGRNFITPFDREDIHYLAGALDDIADNIYNGAKKMHMYNLDPKDENFVQNAKYIHEGVLCIREAVMALRHMRHIRNVTDALIKINDIENLADDVFDQSIQHLFEHETDFKKLIMKRELYQTLEIVTDKIEDASNVIESILIKYA